MNNYDSMTNEQLNVEVAKRTHSLTIEEQDNRVFWVVRHNKSELMYISPALPHATVETGWGYFDVNRLPKPATNANDAIELFDFGDINQKALVMDAVYLLSTSTEFARAVTVTWLCWHDTRGKC